ncbi:MAG TPA: YciI family protein [Stellaceae bacterium]
MQYMLLIYQNEGAMQKMREQDAGALVAAYGAYTKAMVDAGVFVAGDRLDRAANGTTVRTENGKTKVLNGPYAEAKEQLGGYYLIECKDLDVALSWAARCPNVQTGVMEVRPVLKM